MKIFTSYICHILVLAQENLSLLVSVSVTFCPTQLAAALIRLTLISRIVQLLQTLKCIHLLICSVSQGLWAGCLHRIKSHPFPLATGNHSSVLGLRVCLCVCVLMLLMCTVFRVQYPTPSVVGRMETGQGPSICVHTSKASVLYPRTSITACSTPAAEDTA